MEPDKLYLACTRGVQSYWGLPFGVWVFTVYTVYLGYMVIGDAKLLEFRGYIWIPMLYAIPAACRWALTKDPNIFRILRLLVDTFSIHSVIWAAPHRLPRKRGMTSAI